MCLVKGIGNSSSLSVLHGSDFVHKKFENIAAAQKDNILLSCSTACDIASRNAHLQDRGQCLSRTHLRDRGGLNHESSP